MGDQPDDRERKRQVSADTVVDRPGSRPKLATELAHGAARYEPRGQLGAGGMGVVEEVHDNRLGRDVAIKRVLEEHRDQATARFLREAQLQARLEHPCVVPLYDLELDAEGRPFFTMKRVRGVTLNDVLRSSREGNADVLTRWTRRKLLSALSTVCLAVDYAHQRGVVHRDLKPDNIMLGDFGEVYVLDWGIAQLDPEPSEKPTPRPVDATRTGAMIGTPGYAAPEQLRGELDATGPWSDVYALGTILYELLALRPLHDGPSGDARIASQLQGVDVRAKLSDAPPELVAICQRAIADDPDHRYASARDLQEAIERFLDGDRDLELRRALARESLESAREAVARGDSAADRSDAIRAAARALALDPHAPEPAELVGRLMIEPPAEPPPEVERELEEAEDADVRSGVRRTAWAIAMLVVFLPVLYWAGFREMWQLLAIGAFTAFYITCAVLVSQRTLLVLRFAMFPTFCAFVALIGWMTTPFLIAPVLAGVGMMSLSIHPRTIPAPVLIAGGIAAVLLPWAAGLVSNASPRTAIAGNTLVLRLEASTLHAPAFIIGLVLFVVTMIAYAVWVPRRLALEKRENQRALRLQAWQLRQLVSTTT